MRNPLRFVSSDPALVRRASRGEEAAFAAIFERYHQDIYRYCRAILRDPDEAQDALQNTMTKAIRALPGEERSITLKPWLYRIAHNEAISVIRERGDAVEIADETLTSPPPDVAAEHREAVRQLVSDLDDLPEKQRAALVMKELSGLSHVEIAEALEVTPGAARQSVYEARTALQQLSEGRDMDCEYVRQAISDSDGRVMRGRRIRAHLNSCPGCEDFAAAIGTRQQVFSFAAPALPVAASTGIFAAASGGGAAISAGAGAFGAGTLGIVATGAVVLAGAGSFAGIQLADGGNSNRTPAAIESAPDTDAGAQDDAKVWDSRTSRERPAGNAGDRSQAVDRGRNTRDDGDPRREPKATASEVAVGSGNGASDAAQAESGRPQTPPGSAGAAENSGGNANTPTTGPPVHAQGPPDHSNAGGTGSNAGGIGKPDK